MKKLELDAFLDYRFLSHLNLSPDGKKAAVVVSKANDDREKNDYVSEIFLMKKDHFEKLTGMQAESDYLWEDETHLIFPAARTEKEKERKKAGEQFTAYYRISTEGGEASFAFELPYAGSLSEKLPDGRFIVRGGLSAAHPDFYKLSKEKQADVLKEMKEEADYEVLTEIPFYVNGGGFIDKKRQGLFIYDPSTGSSELVSDPKYSAGAYALLGDTLYFTQNIHGDVVYDGRDTVFAYDLKTKKRRKAASEKDMEFYDLFVMEGGLFALASTETKRHISDDPGFFRIDTANGKITEFVKKRFGAFNSTGSDCRLGGTRDAKAANGAYYFVETVRNDAVLKKLDKDGRVTTVIDRAGSIDDFTVSDDGRILVTALYDNRLEEVYEKAARGKNVRKLSGFNDAVLDDVYVADYQKMTIRSEGVDIDGWVLLPKDYDETKTYPAILDIHGGPRTVYGEIFYHEMQYWANEGYFVFFCNPVGGSGRGLKFADITGIYGSIDYKNIMDFTDAVLEKYPQIDPARVGCTGGSYGGYMSNWILGHTDRFACIATQRSISNWISFYGVSDIGYFFVKNQHGQDIYSEEGLKALWDLSPLKYINDMKTPTLFIHSNEDYRCPMEQGMQLFTALKEKGVPSRFVYFKGESHELSRSGKPKHRVRRLKEITDWMNTYCR